MPNIITATRTYATMATCMAALDKAHDRLDLPARSLRYLVAIGSDGRYVPTVLPSRDQMHMALPLAHMGIMVIS